jgi:hypothetical protein
MKDKVQANPDWVLPNKCTPCWRKKKQQYEAKQYVPSFTPSDNNTHQLHLQLQLQAKQLEAAQLQAKHLETQMRIMQVQATQQIHPSAPHIMQQPQAQIHPSAPHIMQQLQAQIHPSAPHIMQQPQAQIHPSAPHIMQQLQAQIHPSAPHIMQQLQAQIHPSAPHIMQQPQPQVDQNHEVIKRVRQNIMDLQNNSQIILAISEPTSQQAKIQEELRKLLSIQEINMMTPMQLYQLALLIAGKRYCKIILTGKPFCGFGASCKSFDAHPTSEEFMQMKIAFQLMQTQTPQNNLTPMQAFQLQQKKAGQAHCCWELKFGNCRNGSTCQNEASHYKPTASPTNKPTASLKVLNPKKWANKPNFNVLSEVSDVSQTPIDSKTIETPIDSKTIDTPNDSKTIETLNDSKTIETPIDRKTIETPIDRKTIETSSDSKTIETPIDRKTIKTPNDSKTIETHIDSKTIETPSPMVGMPARANAIGNTNLRLLPKKGWNIPRK